MPSLVPFDSTSNYAAVVNEAKGLKARGASVEENTRAFLRRFPHWGHNPQAIILLMIKAGYTNIQLSTAIKLWVGSSGYIKALKILQKAGLPEAQISDLMTRMGAGFAEHAFERVTGIAIELLSAILAGDLSAITATMAAVGQAILDGLNRGLTYIEEGAKEVVKTLEPLTPTTWGLS